MNGIRDRSTHVSRVDRCSYVSVKIKEVVEGRSYINHLTHVYEWHTRQEHTCVTCWQV